MEGLAVVPVKNPCLKCQFSDSDKNNSICSKCEARSLYALYSSRECLYNAEEIASIERSLIAAIPTQERINAIYKKITAPTAPRPQGSYAGTKPRMYLRTFRAFYRTAKQEGYPGIKEWFNLIASGEKRLSIVRINHTGRNGLSAKMARERLLISSGILKTGANLRRWMLSLRV